MKKIKNPPHISIVTETYAPEINGVSNTLGYLVKELVSEGCELQVIRPKQQESDAGVIYDNVEHVTVKGMPLPGYPELKFGLPAKKLIVEQWQTKRPHMVYVATEGPLGWSAVSAANKLGVPVYSGFHTNFQNYSQYYGAGWMRRIIMLYLKAFHNRTLGTMVATPKMQDLLADSGFDNVSVLGRGVDEKRFSPCHRNRKLRASWGLSDNDLAVIYVGRIAPEKNLNLAISCYQRLATMNPKTRFILVGDGPMKKALKQKYKHFIFCGKKTGEALSQHYASGDIFLFPSKTDTFGNVVTEAMASGLGVVSFNDASAAALIDHQINGMKADLDDDEQFTRHALSLVNQPTLLNEIRQQARTTALTLSWSQIAQQLLSITQPSLRIGQTNEYAKCF